MDTKSPLASKTIIGWAILLIAFLARRLGFDAPADDPVLRVLAEAVVEVIGLALVLWGRLAARQRIALPGDSGGTGGATTPALAALALLTLPGCATTAGLCYTRGDVTVCTRTDGSTVTVEGELRDGKTVIASGDVSFPLSQQSAIGNRQ